MASQADRIKELEWRVKILEETIGLLAEGMSPAYVREKIDKYRNLYPFVEFEYP